MGSEAERSVLVAIPPMRAEHARRLLAPPHVPTLIAPALGRACRARALAVPVRLVVPTVATGVRLARALHGVTGGLSPLVTPADERPELRALASGTTLVVDPTRLDAVARLHLEALLDDGDAWVLAITTPEHALDDALAERLGAVVVDVPPLSRRTLELPALSSAILHTIARRAGRDAPVLAPAARTRLAATAWPGDVLELERVLARALASTDATTIGVEHLGLDPEPAPPVDVDEPAAEPPPPDRRLELLMAELSHELLNPLSTVKVFATHLPQLLDDAALRAQFAERTDEAVDRIQQLLDNVVAFARLGAPRHEPVEVGPLLDRLLGEMAPALGERAVRVQRTGDADATCSADPTQLEYAMRNLLAGVVREVPSRDDLVVDTARNGVVSVRFHAPDSTAGRLRRLTTDDAEALADPTLLPLQFTLARAVLERNGGALAVRDGGDGPTTLVVNLPPVEGMRMRNG
jgi:signal transduction histidine kinase